MQFHKQDKCDRLWCECYQSGRKTCKTNNMPWADGTNCGKNKVCALGILHRNTGSKIWN